MLGLPKPGTERYKNSSLTPQICFTPSLLPTYHRSWVICEGPIKCFDVLELKHVPLHKCFPNFLISPRDEELVIMVSLLCQSSGKINWSL